VILREYQTKTIEAARDSIRFGNKRIIIQANCGAGKTIIAASIISKALEKGNKSIFLVHFRQLAYQALERFIDFGMGSDVGLIMAGEESHLDRPIQIISVQTYERRLKLDESQYNPWFQSADIVVYDECHSSIAPTRKAILDLYQDQAIIIGLTATPMRGDQRGLGEVYEDIVTCSSIADLTSQGFLVPARYFGAKHSPDLSNIPTVAGDYNQKVVGERVDKAKLVGDILDNWLRIGGDRQTVIFATNVAHSKHIEQVFTNKGISIEHVDAHTSTDDRKDVLTRFENGDTRIVTNVGVFSEGADFPWASAVVLAKPTKSYGRFVQMAGRGLRPYPRKKDCILIDHAGLIPRHGFLEEEVEWSLDGNKKAWIKSQREVTKKSIQCRACGLIFYGSNICPDCGTECKSFGKEIETVDADLQELKQKKVTNKNMDWLDKRLVMGALVWHAEKKGYKNGWIAHTYKDYFGVWPNDKRVKGVPAITPEGAIKNILTHILIKKAKSYKKKKATEAHQGDSENSERLIQEHLEAKHGH